MSKTILATTAALVLAGCADPLSRVEKLSDVSLAEDAPVREAAASPEEIDRQGGFLGGLFRGSARVESDLRDDASDAATDDRAAQSEGGETAPVVAEPTQGGFFARLFGGNGDAEAAGGIAGNSDTVVATRTRGEFGRGSRATRTVRPADAAQDVEYGTLLPFSTVGRVCEARNRPKGVRVERSDAGFDIYDTAPGTTNARTFYVTGFSDGCPRQFTAALAMFGAPSMHEQLRYGLPSDEYPYSETDKAYEKVKSAICRVGRRKPCGSRIRTLERNTVFISTYERFTGNGRWADILVHDGAVLAASLKDP